MAFQIARVDAQGNQVYTEQDFDQPSRLPSGNTLREALTDLATVTTGWTVDQDGDFAFRPATVAGARLWDNDGQRVADAQGQVGGIITVAEAQGIVAQSDARRAASLAASGTGNS